MEAFPLFLLWWLFGCRPGGGAPALPSGMPGGEPGWPGSPISFTPPWPQARPSSGLPPFPGLGWEFDEPPPPAVQQRARQLVEALWAQGSGATRLEQTAGRWITYQAQVVASGKRGVVAYRQKRPLPPAAPQPTLTAARARNVPATPYETRVTPNPPRRAPSRASSSSSSSAPASSSSPAPGPAEMKPASAPAPVSATNPNTMPVLVRGAGIKPKPPSPNVKLLQQRLGIEADGQFGAGTEKAVRAYQKKHGLIVDGIVGPDTWTSLFAVHV